MMSQRFASIVGILVGATVVAALLSLSPGSPALGWFFGGSLFFDKPAVPEGAKSEGPTTKGTLTMELTRDLSTNELHLTSEFNGVCILDDKTEHVVNTGNIDVSNFSDPDGFAAATAKEIERDIEGTYLDKVFFQGLGINLFDLFGRCYPKVTDGQFLGVLVVSSKTVTLITDTDEDNKVTRKLWVADTSHHVVYDKMK